jgi:uncharacterized protein
MEFRLETGEDLNLIAHYHEGAVRIGDREFHECILVQPGKAVSVWPVQSLDMLRAAHFDTLVTLKPEIVLLGTGDRQRFPAPAVTAALVHAGIGIEVMDTASACRTYNVLAAEGRDVCAVLFMIKP